MVRTSGDPLLFTSQVNAAISDTDSTIPVGRILTMDLRYCVKQGNKSALVVGKGVYNLEGHEAELDKYAAQKVTVKGTVKGETVTVGSVSPAK